MLDIHPPHEAAHTWKDFFIHIATICVGLLIAIALEQAVERLHHHYQAAELVEAMRTEASNNVPILRESALRLEAHSAYMEALAKALRPGKQSGQEVSVTGVAPPISSILFLSPSRAAWSNAQTSGIAALLPSPEALLYARLDFNARLESLAEEEMLKSVGDVMAECAAAHFSHTDPSPQIMTVAHRDQLLLRIERANIDIDRLDHVMVILEGGDEAVADGVRSLSGMYPFQNAALARSHLRGDLEEFYGGRNQFQTNDKIQPAGR